MTKNKSDAPFDLDHYIVSLLQNEPFFAGISRHVDKHSSEQVPTAGVRITPSGHYEMLYNPAFFEKLTNKQRVAVLKHEFYHLIFGHVTDRLPFDEKEGKAKMNKRWNIATDLAINSFIAEELPDMACVPGKGPFANLPLEKSSEWYYANLPQDMGKDGDGIPDFDDHSEWGENSDALDPSVKEMAKQRLKEMMKDAAESANKASNGWGTMPQSVRQEIMNRISAKVDWRSVLRYAIKASRRCNKSSTVKRINKRFPMIHAGKKVERIANVAISIDQSGSVSDEMLEKFFAELNNLSKLATFTVIPFDCTVDEKLVYTWKKGKHRKAERVKNGGTNFDEPTKYVNARNFELHIILTDMYAPKPGPSKCPRLWMTTADCYRNPYFQTNERVVSID